MGMSYVGSYILHLLFELNLLFKRLKHLLILQQGVKHLKINIFSILKPQLEEKHSWSHLGEKSNFFEIWVNSHLYDNQDN